MRTRNKDLPVNEPMNGSNDRVVNKNLSEEGQDSVMVGQVYREKNGKREVIPFFVDMHTAIVQFADVGRSNEDRMRSSDFLNRFEFQGAASASNEVVPKEKTGQLDNEGKRA